MLGFEEELDFGEDDCICKCLIVPTVFGEEFEKGKAVLERERESVCLERERERVFGAWGGEVFDRFVLNETERASYRRIHLGVQSVGEQLFTIIGIGV